MRNDCQWLIMLLIQALLLTGCGSGGGSSGDGSPRTLGTTTLSGSGTKGRMAFATVRLYRYDAPNWNLIGETQSDDQGQYSLDINNAVVALHRLDFTPKTDGTTLIECDSIGDCGSVNFGQWQSISDQFTLSSLFYIDTAQDTTEVHVSAVTHLITQAVKRTGYSPENLLRQDRAIATRFGLDDATGFTGTISSVRPITPAEIFNTEEQTLTTNVPSVASLISGALNAAIVSSFSSFDKLITALVENQLRLRIETIEDTSGLDADVLINNSRTELRGITNLPNRIQQQINEAEAIINAHENIIIANTPEAVTLLSPVEKTRAFLQGLRETFTFFSSESVALKPQLSAAAENFHAITTLIGRDTQIMLDALGDILEALNANQNMQTFTQNNLDFEASDLSTNENLTQRTIYVRGIADEGAQINDTLILTETATLTTDTAAITTRTVNWQITNGTLESGNIRMHINQSDQDQTSTLSIVHQNTIDYRLGLLATNLNDLKNATLSTDLNVRLTRTLDNTDLFSGRLGAEWAIDNTPDNSINNVDKRISADLLRTLFARGTMNLDTGETIQAQLNLTEIDGKYTASLLGQDTRFYQATGRLIASVSVQLTEHQKVSFELNDLFKYNDFKGLFVNLPFPPSEPLQAYEPNYQSGSVTIDWDSYQYRVQPESFTSIDRFEDLFNCKKYQNGAFQISDHYGVTLIFNSGAACDSGDFKVGNEDTGNLSRNSSGLWLARFSDGRFESLY